MLDEFIFFRSLLIPKIEAAFKTENKFNANFRKKMSSVLHWNYQHCQHYYNPYLLSYEIVTPLGFSPSCWSTRGKWGIKYPLSNGNLYSFHIPILNIPFLPIPPTVTKGRKKEIGQKTGKNTVRSSLDLEKRCGAAFLSQQNILPGNHFQRDQLINTQSFSPHLEWDCVSTCIFYQAGYENDTMHNKQYFLSLPISGSPFLEGAPQELVGVLLTGMSLNSL